MTLAKKNQVKPNSRKEREALRRKFKPVYEPVFAGMRRCIVCGCAFGDGEENNHKYLHSSFITAKQKERDSVLTYEEVQHMELNLIEIMKDIKNGDKMSKDIYSELALSLIYKLEYNYSQIFWEYGKDHPTLEEYIKLLWNTKSFLLKVKRFFPSNVLLNKIYKHKSNNSMRECSDLFLDSFVFTRVEEFTGIDEEIIIALTNSDDQLSNSPFYEKATKCMKLDTDRVCDLIASRIA